MTKLPSNTEKARYPRFVKTEIMLVENRFPVPEIIGIFPFGLKLLPVA